MVLRYLRISIKVNSGGGGWGVALQINPKGMVGQEQLSKRFI